MKAKRALLGISLREAAKATGMSHVHVKDIEDGNINPSFEKVMRLLEAYNADIQEFLAIIGYLPKQTESAPSEGPQMVPVVSWVAAGRWQDAIEPYQPGTADEWVSSDVKGEGIFAIRVKGDSMEPEFTEGDVVVLNPTVQVSPGDYVVVRNEEGEATLKQLKRYGNTQVLHPLNSKYKDIVLSEEEEYSIVGKVMEKKKVY